MTEQAETVTIEQLTSAQIEVALVLTQNLSVEKLAEMLKKKRQEERAQRLLNEVVVPFPEYVKPTGKEDVLNYEYGLELAFRPMRKPSLITAQELAPLMHVKPFLKKPQGRSHKPGSWHYTGDTCVLQHMFEDMLEEVIPLIGASKGSSRLSSCGEGEIEFVSPIMERWSQIEWYYKLIRGIADKLGAKVDTDKVNSGGGHIHVSPKGKSKPETGVFSLSTAANKKNQWEDWQLAVIVIEACQQPWLPWIFNDPEDKTTARCAAIDVLKTVWEGFGSSAPWYTHRLDRRLGNNAVRINSQRKTTLEFRMFAAPHNLEEQKLHVMFVDGFIKWCLSRPNMRTRIREEPKLKYITPSDLREITYDTAVGRFKDQLDKLGLEWAAYKVFVERNMKKRYDNGWVRD